MAARVNGCNMGPDACLKIAIIGDQGRGFAVGFQAEA